MSFGIKVTGLAETIKAMKALPEKTSRKVLPPAVRAAARPVTLAARANLSRNKSVETGLLKKSLGVIVRRYKNVTWAGIGPRTGFKKVIDGKARNPVRYAHFVEKGTSRQSPKPFLRPALDNTRNNQLSAFVAKAQEQFKKLKVK
jgi:HK97 gp10 family phage protein